MLSCNLAASLTFILVRILWLCRCRAVRTLAGRSSNTLASCTFHSWQSCARSSNCSFKVTHRRSGGTLEWGAHGQGEIPGHSLPQLRASSPFPSTDASLGIVEWGVILPRFLCCREADGLSSGGWLEQTGCPGHVKECLFWTCPVHV